MESKKINQLATEMAPVASDLTIIGDPITGVSKKITLEQLAVLFGGAISFYSSYASFPATGDVDIIYCAKDTNKLYLWNGAYVEIFPSQALLDTYQLRSEKGNANGYASLDSLGKVPVSQLPSSLMEYKGTWNASTNTPTLANGTGDTGDVYICSVAGTVNFGAGAITFAVGDYVIYSGTIWQRSSGATGTVTSVAVTESGDALSITGSPITTSGTINIGFAGSSAQYVAGDGSLITFPTIFSEARSLVTEVYNSTGATLTKGTVVYINGGQGNLPTVTKAQANSEVNSAQTYGVVKSDITNMNNGYVIVAGSLGNLDTQAFSAGTTLYLSPSTAGAYTSTKPTSPNHIVYIGVIVRSHPTLGVIEVNIQNTQELGESADVLLSSPANNEGVFYESSTSLWKNKSIATVLGYTPISLASLSATTPLSYNNTTGAFSISQASGSADGYLSSTDWTTFNSKQDALTNPITGTGASGRIAYFNGTTTQTSSANLTWDATNNRLGIGLNNPQRSLEIYNATADSHLRLSGAAPTVSMGEAITGAVYQAKFGLITSNGQFVTGGLAGDFVIISQTGATIWATSGGEKMRLTSGGNLGIGTTSPTFTLDVTGTGRFTGALTATTALLNGSEVSILADGIKANRSPATSSSAIFNANNGSANIISNSGLTSNYTPITFRVSDGTTTNEVVRITGVGNVGIGTASPGRLLNVSGGGTDGTQLQINGTVASAGIKLIPTTGDNWEIQANTSNQFFVYNRTDSAYRFLIDGTGNVGIGTSSFPTFTGATQLVLKGATGNATIQAVSADGGTSLTMYAGGSSSDDPLILFQKNLRFGSATDTVLGGYAERMRITSTGNVGIGTTSPQTLLSVETSGTQSTVSPIITAQSSGTTYTGLYSIRDGAGDQRGLIFQVYTANVGLSEKMRITSGGTVCIGRTSAPSSAYKMAVQETIMMAVNTNTNNMVNFFNESDTYVASIVVNASTVAYGTGSDYRLKEDLKDFNGLDKISAIKVYDFKFKAEGDRMEGVLAHELQEVIPYAVTGVKDEKNKDGSNKIQNVDYSKLVPVLVKAIQEQQQQIDELKAKIK
jgi:hypothetical protein